jgi:hypothetical protein
MRRLYDAQEVSRMSATTPPAPDDERWPDHVSRNGATANVRRDSVHRFVVLGYILAASMPPIGLVLGIVLAIRSTGPNSRHGLGIIAVSVVASLVWIPIIVSGALSTPSTSF